MDKKNTMLLTVIAVATLLVAVVGATFAYFSISANKDSATSKITGSTENAEVGGVVLTGDQSLKLTLTAEHMATAKQGTTYYASKNGVPVESTEQDSKVNKLDVGVASLTGGSAGVVYYCTANYKVTYSEKEDSNITWSDGTGEQVALGDDAAVLTFYTDTGVDITGDMASAIKLKDLKDASVAGKTGVVTFTITGTGDKQTPVTKTLQASLAVKNSDKDQRERLAGKEFYVNIEATSFKCDTVAPAAD